MKKFFSAFLLMAAMAFSVGTFVSCNDVMDEIEDVKAQTTQNTAAIDALNAEIADLKNELADAQAAAEEAMEAAEEAQGTADDALEAAEAAALEAAANAEAIEALIEALQAARKAKDFKEADRIRDELKAQGITHFISVRDNVLETLKGYLKELGI